ncbi:MAG: hypothetical protein ABW019_15475 [Chitinophagaceae bacterium]
MGRADDHTARETRFITLQTVDWVDLFIRPVYKQMIVHSLNHFIESKGLVVYAWCLMTHHLHLLAKSDNNNCIADLENEYRAFTTTKLLEAIDTEPAVRKEWMLSRFKNYSLFGFGKKLQVWEGSNSSAFVSMKQPELIGHIGYIHQNPLRDKIVDAPAEYLYSSARDYSGSRGLVQVTKLPAAEQQLAAGEYMQAGFRVHYIRN